MSCASFVNCLISVVSAFLIVGIDGQRPSSDTIFSRGGTCMYKIQPEYASCMSHQKSRLVEESAALAPIYSNDVLEASVNRISCCAYWEFIDCVKEIVVEKCPQTPLHDVEAYVRQIGSAVPVDICVEQFPRDSEDCRPSGGLLSFFSSGGKGAAAGTTTGGGLMILLLVAIVVGRLLM